MTVLKRRKLILKLLKDKGPLGAREIEEALKMTKGAVWYALKGLEFGQHENSQWYAKR